MHDILYHPARAGLPSLKALQWKRKRLKKAKVAAVCVTSLLELKQHFLPLEMPSSLDLIVADDESGALVAGIATSDVIYIPMPDVYNVEGACLTGPMQIQWIGQLKAMPRQFVLHTDSKFKLHHGDWVLTTLGTHWLRWDAHNRTLSTSFAPLVYLMCKQHESVGAGQMLMTAANNICLKYFGAKLEPGAVMADHSSGLHAAYASVWPDVPFGQCWPHIARKWSEGEYATKTWEHFDEVLPQLQSIHLAHTAEMRDLLMAEFGDVWESWGTQMNKFWNTYCREPWDNWSVGLFDCMLCTPSQQAQETWHRSLLQSKVPNMLRGSTAMCFAETLPQLIEMDAVAIPSILPFHVPAVPKEMIKKALWYVDNRETHLHIFNPQDCEDQFAYYILRKDNKSGLKKIETRLVEMYLAAARGEWDRRIKDLDHLADICASMHLLVEEDPSWPIPDCELNPLRLDCQYCKGFKGYGICSHVLAVNHITQKINLRRLVLEIGRSRMHKTGGGNREKAIPALQRAPQAEEDSSDEELYALMEAGRQGR